MKTIEERAREFVEGLELGTFDSATNRKMFCDLFTMFAEKYLSDKDAEIATLRTALAEANKRNDIQQKVINDKNASRNKINYLPMTLNEYQEKAMGTCLPSCDNDCYMLFGLVEEVGELCGKLSKAIRKGQETTLYNNLHPTARVESDAEFKEQIKLEAGDVLWMLAGLCKQFDWTLEDVARANLEKLANRKAAGTIVEHTDH